MNILMLLIPVSLALGALGVGAFVWALRSNQFSDPDGAAARILLDDDAPPVAEDAAPDDPARRDEG